MTRRFETADKFWEVRLDNTTLQTRSGKRGTDGRGTLPKVHKTRERAEQEVAKLVAAQQAKGFVEVTRAVPREPENAALAQQIVEEPTDAGRFLVYADWLQGQGHPRGELGVAQARRAERPGDASVTKAIRALFDAHPELAPARVIEAMTRPSRSGETDLDRCTVTWENGFIAAARLARASDREQVTVRELVGDLLAHPAARFLRELRIGGLGPDDHAYAATIEEIIRGCPSTLRVLSLVDLPPGTPKLVFANLADVTPLLAATPLLEELRLAGNQLAVTAIALPALRRFAIATVDADVLACVASAHLPALVSIHVSAAGAALPPESVVKLLAPAWRATELAVTHTANTDHVVSRVLKSPLLPGLARLDLSNGALTDAGAQLLLGARAALEHLAELDLAGNMLSPAMAAQLGDVCARVRVDRQRAVTATPISDEQLRRMSPDVGALGKARALANPRFWPSLGRDGDTLWGRHRGSDLYDVFVRVPSLANGCSCPSGKRPCKHAIALAILAASGHAFAAVAAPATLMRNAAASPRYGGGGE